MNTRSLAFRLIIWYAGVLIAAFTLVGAMALLGLEQYLEGNLQKTLELRLTQAKEIVADAHISRDKRAMAETIEDRLAPEFSNRFVRVLQSNGAELYRSNSPDDHSFDPALIPLPAINPAPIREATPGGKHVLLLASRVTTDRGDYIVEIGSSLEQIQSVEDHLLTLALLMLPALAGMAIGGGYLLVKRALTPVEDITKRAEQITHHNLSERLPVARTGEELERLSIALNHMIARLDEAFQNSRRFLADASHELRTPLTIIKGELEQLALQYEGRTHADDDRNRIGSVLEEVQRVIVIVEGLFALSRLDAGEAQREWVSFNLAELVAGTAEQMALLAEDEGLTIICDTLQPVNVAGDRSRIKQVVVNLIDNAIKYSLAGGTIHLSVSRQRDGALLEVKDEGIGIPQDSLSLVFERFFRVDKARSRGGAGLGLAIVKSICTAHNGTVEVERAMPSGSRFTVTLPLAEEITPDVQYTSPDAIPVAPSQTTFAELRRISEYMP